MPDGIEQLSPGEVIAFGRNLDLVGQQMKSRCVAHVDADLSFSEKGVMFTHNQIGISDPEEMASEFSPTPDKHIPKYERVASFSYYADSAWLSDREKAEKLVDVTNGTVQSLGAGKERLRDRKIIGSLSKPGGIFGIQQAKDQDGAIAPVAFPASQKIAHDYSGYHLGKADGVAAPASTPTCLSMMKIRASKVLLKKAELFTRMGYQPVCFVEPEDLENMGTSEELRNGDYNNKDKENLERLQDGEIDVFKGIKFVQVGSGFLPSAGAGKFYVPIFFEKALQYKERQMQGTNIWKRPDVRGRWQAYYETACGSMRTEDTGFVWIEVER